MSYTGPPSRYGCTQDYSIVLKTVGDGKWARIAMLWLHLEEFTNNNFQVVWLIPFLLVFLYRRTCTAV